MRTPLLALAAALTVLACHAYPHDAVVCTSDSDCAADNSCLPHWQTTDAGCIATERACLKRCTDAADCDYCGQFGTCARHVCDQGGPLTCGAFCGDGK